METPTTLETTEHATSASATRSTPVILSWGLGVDSSAILTRWLLDPSSRDFDLADLTVIVAMTGDEHPSSGHLASEHLLPLLRRHGVRLVQVARGGPSQRDGIVVLSDSRSPDRLHIEGAWTLSDELRTTGTVPQVASGRRLCSIKFKGWVLDTWIDKDLGERPYRHVMGFNADEQFRITRDQSYSTVQRASEYPLLGWEWGRVLCEDYLRDTFDVDWPKSCCTFCPFAGNVAGLPAMLARWRREPAGAVTALLLEHTATALNPNSTLFATRAARDQVAAADATELLEAFETELETSAWALYRVRRVFFAKKGDATKKGAAWRSVEPLVTGTRAEMRATLAAQAQTLEIDICEPSVEDPHPRVWVRERGTSFPTVEEMLTVAPVGVPAKERAGFATAWARHATDDQLDLFADGA